MKTIALIGPAGSGKSEVGKYLQLRWGYESRPFAEPLKKMLEPLGVPLESLYGKQKEQPLEQFAGASARHLMQSLGDWGRHSSTCSKNIWVTTWCHAVQKKGKVVVDDARFPDELSVVRARDGIIVHVHRPLNPSESCHSEHVSETSLVYGKEADFTLLNGWGLERLYDEVDLLVMSLLDKEKEKREGVCQDDGEPTLVQHDI